MSKLIFINGLMTMTMGNQSMSLAHMSSHKSVPPILTPQLLSKQPEQVLVISIPSQTIHKSAKESSQHLGGHMPQEQIHLKTMNN